MIILHVTESLGGGTQSAIRTISSTYTAKHVVLGRVRDGEDTGDFGESVSVERRSGGILTLLLRARALCSEIRPDIVHLHSSKAGLARALLPAGTRIVYSPHCFAFERRDIPDFVRRGIRSIEWLLGRRRQTIAAVSPYERELAQALLSRRSAAVLTPNVSTLPVGEATAKGSDWHVVTCGRIGSQKDPGFFADVARTAGTAMRFTWIGDGDPELRQRLVESGVAVTGWLSAPDIQNVYENATVYLHTALWEASPLTLLDAARSGVPVIVRSVPSLASLGYAVVDSDPAGVVELLEHLRTDGAAFDAIAHQTAAVSERNSFAELSLALRSVYG